MKYLSLFSGIGGFEVAIHKVYPDAECIGYSEIKPYAITVYKQHYPSHINLGDVRKITNKQLTRLVKEKGCDIIFGGFPCTNLSSLASLRGDDSGLEGEKSGLFYEMLRVIKTVNKTLKKQVHVIFENNASMTIKNRENITKLIKKLYPNIHMTLINSANFGVQWRRRIFWTSFKISLDDIKCSQTWDSILEPLDKCKTQVISKKMADCFNKLYKKNNYRGKTRIIVSNKDGTFKFKFIKNFTEKSRWEIYPIHSDNMKTQMYEPYPTGKSRPIIANASGGCANSLIDRRISKDGNTFLFRKLHCVEIERLFFLPDNYTSGVSDTKRNNLLGNSVVVRVIEFILKQM